jgi:molybdenum cofactor guanylyltransferase
LRDSLDEAATATLEHVDSTAPVICESNSLRHVVEPGLFLMMQRLGSEAVKTSAAEVWDLADRVIPVDLDKGNAGEPDHADFAFVDGVWSMRQEAAAIVLAGGDSRRMGRDKGSLPVEGRTLIERLCARLRPHFSELLISTRGSGDYSFLRERVVPDRVPGAGPLMGIAACLAASTHDVNLVMACDIPGLDVGLLRRMSRLAPDHDCVVPRTADGRPEPLFAIYRKSALPAIRQTLDSGERKVREAFRRCRTAYVDVEAGRELINLNTMDDYRAYTASRATGSPTGETT